MKLAIGIAVISATLGLGAGLSGTSDGAGSGRRCSGWGSPSRVPAATTPDHVQGQDRLRLRGRHGRRRPAASRRRARELAEKTEHSSLIEIRKDFIPEMLKSLEDV